MATEMAAMLKHCFHRVKNRLHEKDPAFLDQHIPQEDGYRQYLAEYIEEFASPFSDLAERENPGEDVKLIFQKYYINQASLKSMLDFLKEFSQKPFSKIDLSHHEQGIIAFKNFIRRWENNAQGNDLVELYKRYNESFG